MTTEELDSYLELLKTEGWNVELKQDGGVNLSESFTTRYPRSPEDYVKFLARVASCANAADNCWFICTDDYNGSSDAAFAWNEFEQIEAESAEGEDEALVEIHTFWDRHLPFMLSVGGDYAYLALVVSGDKYGSVVDGYGPDFEGVTEVASSFEEFVRLHSSAVKGNNPDLKEFV